MARFAYALILRYFSPFFAFAMMCRRLMPAPRERAAAAADAADRLMRR